MTARLVGHLAKFKLFAVLWNLLPRFASIISNGKVQLTFVIVGLKVARRTVLVVEDEPLLLMNIADELSEAGFNVIESRNADHALRQFENRSGIEILFTDVDMPGSMDGLELGNIVRQRWPDVTVIITSGKLSTDEETLLSGALFIPKPYSATELVDAIKLVDGQ